MTEVAEITLSARWEGERKRIEEQHKNRQESQRSRDLIRAAQQEAVAKAGA